MADRFRSHGQTGPVYDAEMVGTSLPDGRVYDPDSDQYIDPATGREDEICRRLRQIEQSGLGTEGRH